MEDGLHVKVTFTCYYTYEVTIDPELYEENPVAAEKYAIAKAYEEFCCPVVDANYDKVEVEVQ